MMCYSSFNIFMERKNMGNNNFYVYDQTQMTFHKINFGLMILTFVSAMRNIFDIFALRNELLEYEHMDESMDALIGLSGFMAVMQIIAIVLLVIMLYGFISRTYYSLVSLLVYYAFMIVFLIVQAVIYTKYLPKEASETYWYLLIEVALAIPICIYYLKRKPLFNGQYNIKTQSYNVPIESDPNIIDSTIVENDIVE